MENPKYVHDCDACIFLGRYYNNETSEEMDLYFCGDGSRDCTVLARYGDDGSEYSSGLVSIRVSEPLKEAYNRALAKGVVHQDIIDRLELENIQKALKNYRDVLWRRSLEARKSGKYTESGFAYKTENLMNVEEDIENLISETYVRK